MEMPHVSKNFLEKNKFLEINKDLYRVMSSLVRSGKTKTILDELLTKTEKIMLSKRLAIIIMLEADESIYAISKILKVSFSTVGRMANFYEKGKYDGLLAEIKAQRGIWHQISKIIPPKVGRNRFKNFLQF